MMFISSRIRSYSFDGKLVSYLCRVFLIDLDAFALNYGMIDPFDLGEGRIVVARPLTKLLSFGI
jgi:hypothetical protein